MSLIPGRVRIYPTREHGMYLLHGVNKPDPKYSLPESLYCMCLVHEDGLEAMFGSEVEERCRELRGDDYVEVAVKAKLTVDTFDPLEE